MKRDIRTHNNLRKGRRHAAALLCAFLLAGMLSACRAAPAPETPPAVQTNVSSESPQIELSPSAPPASPTPTRKIVDSDEANSGSPAPLLPTSTPAPTVPFPTHTPRPPTPTFTPTATPLTFASLAPQAKTAEASESQSFDQGLALAEPFVDAVYLEQYAGQWSPTRDEMIAIHNASDSDWVPGVALASAPGFDLQHFTFPDVEIYAHDEMLAWSPDGDQIIFGEELGEDVWSRPWRMTREGKDYGLVLPPWSPNSWVYIGHPGQIVQDEARVYRYVTFGGWLDEHTFVLDDWRGPGPHTIDIIDRQLAQMVTAELDMVGYIAAPNARYVPVVFYMGNFFRLGMVTRSYQDEASPWANSHVLREMPSEALDAILPEEANRNSRNIVFRDWRPETSQALVAAYTQSSSEAVTSAVLMTWDVDKAIVTPFLVNGIHGRYSPDGRWLAAVTLGPAQQEAAGSSLQAPLPEIAAGSQPYLQLIDLEKGSTALSLPVMTSDDTDTDYSDKASYNPRLAFSPDGRYLAFVTPGQVGADANGQAGLAQPGTKFINVLDLQSGAILLSAASGEQLPSWAPNSGQLAYRDADNDWQLLDLGSGTTWKITLSGDPEFGQAVWSPSGRYLALNHSPYHDTTVIVPIPLAMRAGQMAGTPPAPLLVRSAPPAAQVQGGVISVSPVFTTTILLENYAGLWSLGYNEMVGFDAGQGTIALATALDFDLQAVDLSSRDEQIYLLDPGLIWSVDGRSFAFLEPGEVAPGETWRLDRKGQNLEPLIPGEPEHMWAHFAGWMDERTLVAVDYAGPGRLGVYILDYLTNKIIAQAYDSGGNLVFTPNRDYVPIADETSGGVFAMARKEVSPADSYPGPYVRSLSRPQAADFPPQPQGRMIFKDWQPGSNRMLVYAYIDDNYNAVPETARLLVWDVDAEQVSDLAPNGIDGRYSPDGRWLAVTTLGAAALQDGKLALAPAAPIPAESIPTLQLVETASGQVRFSLPVVTAPDDLYPNLTAPNPYYTTRLSFSPDSRYLAFITPSSVETDAEGRPLELQSSAAAALNVLDLQSGRIIFAAPASSQLPIWSLQSERLVYQDASGEWQLFDLASGKAAPLTTQGGAQIGRAAWSHAGHFVALYVMEDGKAVHTLIIRVR